MKLFLLFLIFTAFFIDVHGGIFSSTDELEGLIEKEKKLISKLEAFKANYSGPNEEFLKR